MWSFRFSLAILCLSRFAVDAFQPPATLSRPYQRRPLSAVEEGEEMSEPVAPVPQPPAVPPPAQQLPPRKRLDPLLVSVTRNNDPNYANTPKKTFPLIGEVTMDRSLYLIVPAALFGALGLGASLLLLLNSGDAFVNAIGQSVAEASQSPVTTSVPVDGCRGLCSSQEADLEGLRAFMEGLAGK